MSGISFGAPENVCPFIELLSSTGTFRGETSSMVRSIIYREHGKIPKPELENLVLSAVGGIDAITTVKSSENGAALLTRLQEFIDRAFINDPIGSQSDKEAGSDNIDVTQRASSAGADPLHRDELPMPQWVDLAKKEALDDFPKVKVSDVNSPKMQREHLTTNFYSSAGLIGSNAMDSAPAPVGRKEFPVMARPGMRQSRWALGLVAIASLSVAGGLLYDRHEVSSLASNSQLVSESANSSTRGYISSANEIKGGVSNAPLTRSSSVTNTKSARQPVLVAKRTPLVAKPLQARGRVRRAANSRDTRSSSKSSSSPLVADAASRQSLQTVSERSEYPTRLQQFGGRSGMSYSSGVMSADAVSIVPPKYPKLARFAHVQGVVVMQAVVAPDGTVVATRVLSGPRLLRGAAISAVRQWRYRPYVVNGQVAEAATIVTVNFRLPRH